MSVRFSAKVFSCLKIRLLGVRSKHRSFSSLAADHQNMEERKIHVDGMNINYLRVGTGKHPVLLLPGALGTMWTDFRPQIENLDRKAFTIVAWDPPGHGKSRPPDRTFPDDFFQRDAAWAHNLMRALGYTKFSLIGWSDGGITSLIIASTYPDSIRKMVCVAGNSYMRPDEIEIYEKIKNIDTWSEKMRAPLMEAYGEEYFRKSWSEWVDAMKRIYKKQNGNICKELLPRIKCPTLIVYGSKDSLVHAEHSTYLKNHIHGAVMKIFEKGSHSLHLRYPEEFNDLVTKFLLEESKL